MHETIAVVFDFDDTLAPDSTSGYLSQAGITDLSSFWKKDVASLTEDDWDPVPAYLYKMIELSLTGRVPKITKDSLIEWGKRLPLHEGVPGVFARLKNVAKDANPRANLEFYLISSGIGDIVRNTPIANEFIDIWASEFAYGADGGICFPKKIVSFTDKTRYLFHIQKGLVGPQARGKPFDVNKKLKPEQIRIPINHMIFVGDGYTDIPCFSLVKKDGGVSIAVFDKTLGEKWGSAYQFVHDGRVSNLLSANYSEQSDLSIFLSMAVKNLATDIAISSGTYQG
ncbi:haloacid dehalogenase-like hydrolase [Rhodocyclus tenuis]|uniref:Haloacid dehalogenase-like hydrolase n=1 Tax=Rhodocyclus gracilis TaxID=2929842 RepID=A0ABX0WE78_9RHOO|nr:HAD family hydrolase [Rhodocyclus gracilis]NJA87962.1 haloacid dehalogenase-like hydrolase [Rhodocyclus gracilis]